MTEQIVTADQQPVEQPPEQRGSGWRKIGILFSTFAMVVFICGFGYGYYQLSKVNLTLAQSVADLENKIQTNQNELNQAQQTIANLQQNSQKSQDLSNEQEKIMAEWRAAQQGDLNKWRIAESQYLVKLANDHLQFTHNTPLATTLLQRADQVLANLQDASSMQIRKSLATDIANLQTAPQVDTTAIYLRLSGLNAQVDKLPLPTTPLSNEEKTQPTPPAGDLPWWKAGWQKSMETLSKIVIVRYNTSNSLPLALPDEKIFLYQNLHAQMESAMWAILNRNAEIYRASIARSQEWVKQYFVQDAPTTQSFLQNLDELSKVNLQPPSVDLANTLQLFDSALAVQAPQPTQAPPAASVSAQAQ